MVQQIYQRRAKHHQAELYSIERFKTCLAIRLTDRVDSVNFGEVLDELTELLKSEGTVRVVLDMRTVDMLQSVALGRVVQFGKVIRDNGGEFRLCNVQPMIANVLEVTRLNTLVEVADSEESAMRDWVSRVERQNRKPGRNPNRRRRDGGKPRRRLDAAPAASQIPGDDTTTRVAPRKQKPAKPAEAVAQQESVSAAPETSAKPGILQTVYNLGWIGLHSKLGLAVVAVVAIFAGYRLFGTGPHVTSSYRLCVEIYEDVSGLRDAGADASGWNSFQQETRDRMTPHVARLAALGADRSELEGELLATFRSLTTVIEDDRNTPGDADDEVKRHLANAKTLLE